MALPRPPKFPEFARNDVVDPTSGVNNVVEPSESKKDLGHGPSGEFPPRQFLNWVHRITVDWLKWLDEQVIDVLPVKTGTFEAKVTTSDFDAEYTFDIKWQKLGNVVSILIPALLHASVSNRIRIKPSGAAEWPAELIPSTTLSEPFIVIKDSGAEIFTSGLIEVSSSVSGDWDLKAPDTSGDLQDTNFTASNSKGWIQQTITYSTV